jgi:hypothetical protein
MWEGEDFLQQPYRPKQGKQRSLVKPYKGFLPCRKQNLISDISNLFVFLNDLGESS